MAGQKDRSTGEVLSDQWIFTKVKAGLTGEKDLNAGKIEVSVSRGVVTLKGLARTPKERRLAVAIAKTTKGVKDVVDDLTLP